MTSIKRIAGSLSLFGALSLPVASAEAGKSHGGHTGDVPVAVEIVK